MKAHFRNNSLLFASSRVLIMLQLYFITLRVRLWGQFMLTSNSTQMLSDCISELQDPQIFPGEDAPGPPYRAAFGSS